MSELARILDPDELDRAEGPRGRMTIEVPSAWLIEGATLEVTAPTRLACARCEGGGCDSCGRSGAIRPNVADDARTFRLALPSNAAERVLVRLVRPLGAEAGLEQLTVEVRSSSEATPGCRRVKSGSGSDALPPRAVIVGLVAIVLAIVFACLRHVQ